MSLANTDALLAHISGEEILQQLFVSGLNILTKPLWASRVLTCTNAVLEPHENFFCFFPAY